MESPRFPNIDRYKLLDSLTELHSSLDKIREKKGLSEEDYLVLKLKIAKIKSDILLGKNS
jgi:hypothetical protein